MVFLKFGRFFFPQHYSVDFPDKFRYNAGAGVTMMAWAKRGERVL